MFKQATNQEIAAAIEYAREWAETKKEFEAVRLVAYKAVAEYILNENSKTMFYERQ